MRRAKGRGWQKVDESSGVPRREYSGDVNVSVRSYARVVGTALAVLGLGGVLGLWYLSAGAIVLYWFTAAFFLYAGFSRSFLPEEVRYLVGGMGIIYLVSGVLLGVAYEVPAILANYYALTQLILRLTIGTLSIFAARYLPDQRARARSPAKQSYPEDPE